MRKKAAGIKKGVESLTHFVNSLVRTGICDAMGDSISIQDTHFKILYQNKSSLTQFGDNAGSYCYKAYAFLEHVCEKCPLLKVYGNQDDSFTAELKIQRDNIASYYLVTASGLRDKAGKMRAGMCIFRDITGHKHDDLILQQSDETYRTIYNNINDALYLVDAATLRIVDCNQKATELSGYSSRALKNMTIKDLYPSEEQDVVQRIFQKTSKMGNLTGICGIHQFYKNSALVPVEINLTRFSRGEKDYILASARNIAERKAAEEKLQQEYEKMINILDAIEDRIYIVNRQYEIKYINPVFRKSRMPSAGQKCYDYLFNRKSVCTWCRSKDVFAGKKIHWNWSSPLNQKTYDIFEVPLTNHDGNLLKLSVHHDITARINAEGTLMESEEQFRAIFNSSPIGIAITGTDGRFIKTNPAFKNILGYSDKELDQDFMCILHPDDVKKNRDIFQGLPQGARNNYHMENRFCRKDGGIIWAAMSATAVKDREGKKKYNLVMIEDIMARKEMEEKLHQTAITDDLTGLLNRRGFFTIAEKHIKLTQRNNKWLSLLYVDLDGLKMTNDRFGHTTGDKALIDTSNILQKTFRESDVIARIGGDEFAVLMTNPSGPAAEHIITEHLQDNIKVYNQYGKRPYEIRLSTGLAHYDPQNPCSLDELFNKADALMYKDKKQHKHRKDAGPEMTDRRLQKRCQLVNECWVEVDGTYMVRIKDINAGGICLKSPWQLSVHSTHNLKIFPKINGDLFLKGEVVWSSSGKSQHAEVGLKFTETGAGVKLSVENFIRTYNTR